MKHIILNPEFLIHNVEKERIVLSDAILHMWNEIEEKFSQFKTKMEPFFQYKI
jgi:hypothetical protein